jgi:hypothetical protein
MPSYILHAEGVNLAAFVEDTQDLSTIRGGSLALLNAIWRKIAKAARPVLMTPVSVGASIGIYRFEAAGDAEAAKIAEAVRTALKGGVKTQLDKALRHATFVVSLEPEQGGYAGIRQRLTARVRRAQMASATVVYPRQADDPARRNSVCKLDLVRPAAENEKNVIIGGEANPPVSQAVFDRRGYGLVAKQRLYQQLLLEHSATWRLLRDKVHRRAPFAFMLSSISEGNSRTGLRSSLRDKICVMYADGTGFGELERRLIADKDAEHPGDAASRQSKFDQFIRDWRRLLLEGLLGILLREGGYGAPSDEEKAMRAGGDPQATSAAAKAVVRFETLLWGGDEQLFVLPARLGWRFAEAFTDHVKRHPLGDKRLEHGVGLIFCHNDAPIARIRDLAKHLCDEAKSVTRDETMVLPVVLESFDHIGGAPDAFFRNRTPKRMTGSAVPAAPFALNATQLANLQRAAIHFAKQDGDGDQTISRRQIRRLAYAIHTERRRAEHDGTHAGTLLDQINAQARTCFAAIEDDFDALYDTFAFTSGGAAKERFWMLIDEFWDYLVPEPAQPEATP